MDTQSSPRALFYTSMRWGAFETVGYQAILTVHTFALFAIAPSHNYGVTGVIFSLAYAVATIATIGNDIATGLLLGKNPSRRSAQRTLLVHTTQAVFVFCCAALCACFFCVHTKYDVSHIALGFLLALSESVRKIFKSILVNTHYFEKVALREMICICGYVIVVWCLYLVGLHFSPVTIIAPLIGSLIFLNGAYAKLLYNSYFQPHIPYKTGESSLTCIAVIRRKCSSLLSGLEALICSGNSIVPVVAIIADPVSAGTIKLASHCIQGFWLLCERTVGISSTLVFNQIEKEKTTVHLLLFVLRTTAPLVIGSTVAIFGIMHAACILKWLPQTIAPIIRLYIILNLFGVGSLIGERFLIAQRDLFFIFTQIFFILTSGICLYFSGSLGLYGFFFALCIARAIFFAIVWCRLYILCNE